MSDAMYDYYWPGYEDSAPLGHNTVCLLTEVASVNVATPITLSSRRPAAGRGLAEYRAQINFPDPWPGGAWTLRDIVDYDLSAVRGLLRAAAALPRADACSTSIEMGQAGRREPDGAADRSRSSCRPSSTMRTPRAKLRELLIEGADRDRSARSSRSGADGEPYPAGTDIIFLAQPFRAYVKTLLERQDYPARAAAAGRAGRAAVRRRRLDAAAADGRVASEPSRRRSSRRRCRA